MSATEQAAERRRDRATEEIEQLRRLQADIPLLERAKRACRIDTHESGIAQVEVDGETIAVLTEEEAAPIRAAIGAAMRARIARVKRIAERLGR